jgi:hypothetical protein
MVGTESKKGSDDAHRTGQGPCPAARRKGAVLLHQDLPLSKLRTYKHKIANKIEKRHLKDYLVRLAHEENPSRVIICARYESLDLLSMVRALDQRDVMCNRLSGQAIIANQAIIEEGEDAAPKDRATTHKHGADTCELAPSTKGRGFEWRIREVLSEIDSLVHAFLFCKELHATLHTRAGGSSSFSN